MYYIVAHEHDGHELVFFMGRWYTNMTVLVLDVLQKKIDKKDI